jgi:hypothetical protein
MFKHVPPVPASLHSGAPRSKTRQNVDEGPAAWPDQLLSKHVSSHHDSPFFQDALIAGTLSRARVLLNNEQQAFDFSKSEAAALLFLFFNK